MNNIFIFENYNSNINIIFKNLFLLYSTSGKNYKIHLLNNDNLKEYILIPDNFDKLSNFLKLKFIKFSVLYYWGGIWLDNNILLIKDIDFLFNYKKGFFICYNNNIIYDIFGSSPNSFLFEIIIKNINLDISSIYNNFKYLFKDYIIYDETYFYKDIINKKNIFFNNNLSNNNSETQKKLNLNLFNSIYLKKNSKKYFNKNYFYYIYLDENQPLIIFDNSILINNDLNNDFFILKYPINYFINKSFNNLTHLENIDFIEIGSSHFETLIQECDNGDKGITIDPIKYYLDKLPNKHNVKKINVAISDKKGKTNIYYISPKNIENLKLPIWYYGCNSIDDYHPYHLKNDLKKYVSIEEINLIPIYELFYSNKIKKVKYLKIDTEGHDCIILKSLYNYIKYLPKFFYPDVILFEIEMTKDKNLINLVINLYINLGYKLIKKDWDAILIL